MFNIAKIKMCKRGYIFMKKIFLVQTVNGEVKHDFVFHLLRACEYHNWLYGEEVYEVIKKDKINNVDDNKVGRIVPVGGLDFVFKYMDKVLNLKGNREPINIPNSLFKEEYLKRFCEKNKYKEDLDFSGGLLFVKSESAYKKYTDIVKDKRNLEDDKYFISEVVEIESEWRVFVFKELLEMKMVGLRNYIGDFKIFPDINLLEDMISDYVESPSAYTMDVGISRDRGTFLLEIHPFVSCGLYGFDNYKILPMMFVRGFNFLRRTS